MKYQGWKNYGTWGIALVLDNDVDVQPRLFARAQELAGEAPKKEETYWTEEEYVKFTLSDEIKDLVEGVLEDACEGAPSEFARFMASQVLMSGLSEVDWHEIAGHYMEG